MSAPVSVDSLHFAQSAGTLEGQLRAADLPRLRDNLTSEDVAVQYRLSGGVESGRPVLRLVVTGHVWLTCQRCLGPYRQELDMESVLPIARDEAELARWEAEDPLLDALVADARLNTVSLVEDEILLGLPIVPHHPDGLCETVYQA